MGQRGQLHSVPASSLPLLHVAIASSRSKPGGCEEPPLHSLTHASVRGFGHASMQSTSFAQSAFAAHAFSWSQQIASSAGWQLEG